MTRIDHKIIFTALGFLAVILDNVPHDKQALRATTLAKLIEAFCVASLPDAFVSESLDTSRAAEIESLVELYIAALRDAGSSQLDYDRPTLLGMFDFLLIQKTRHEQKEVFASAHDELIANRILELAEERLRWEESA
jgi:hypothetical protein